MIKKKGKEKMIKKKGKEKMNIWKEDD